MPDNSNPTQATDMDCTHEPELVLTPELIHYGKNVCRLCGKFMGWVPNPATLANAVLNMEKIAELKRSKMSEWEAGFLLSIEKQSGRHLSPKQQTTLDKIWSERDV